MKVLVCAFNKERGLSLDYETSRRFVISSSVLSPPGVLTTRTVQISAAWFPPEERTRATSIGQMCNALGVGVSYLLAMAIVTREDAEDSDSCLEVFNNFLIISAIELSFQSKTMRGFAKSLYLQTSHL